MPVRWTEEGHLQGTWGSFGTFPEGLIGTVGHPQGRQCRVRTVERALQCMVSLVAGGHEGQSKVGMNLTVSGQWRSGREGWGQEEQVQF